MEAYKREYRKILEKISTGLGLTGSGGTNKSVEEQDESYVWLIIRVQACVGDTVFLMSVDDLAFKYRDRGVGKIGRVLAHNRT